jgi:putative endonuclease
VAAYVYFMTNGRNGILYVGVTTDLPVRAYQHREGVIAGFTRRYGLKLLVYYEVFDDVRDAIQRGDQALAAGLESAVNSPVQSGLE